MSFDPQRWTTKTQEALMAATEAANAAAHAEVTSTHLFRALITQPEGVVVPSLQRAGLDVAELGAEFSRRLAHLPTVGICRQPVCQNSMRVGSTL